MSRIIARPFLAENATDAEIAKHLERKGRLMASVKIDGIRAVNLPMSDGRGEMRTRSMKWFPNLELNRVFGIPELRGLDGEMAASAPNDPALCRKTSSATSTVRGTASGLKWYVFDDPTIDAPYHERYRLMRERVLDLKMPNVHPLKTHIITSMAELKALEQQAVQENGFEGLIVRDPDAPYKEGRSTVREGYMLKVKRFVESEGVIEDWKELMSNQNEAFENELGLTSRSTAKAGMVPMGVLGAFIVRDVKTGIVTDVGGGLSAIERKDYWDIRELMRGQVITYKYLPQGMKDKPRHTSFVALRDKNLRG